MKTVVILKILLFVLFIKFLPDYKVNEVRNCPAFEPFDWVAITHLLTANNLQLTREKASLNTYSIKESEFISITGVDKNYIAQSQEDANKYLVALGKYWTNKRVTLVIDTTICKKINDVLTTNNNVNELEKIIETRSYFKINDKYLVIYKSSAVKISGLTTVLVLNNQFEIVNQFGM